MQARLSLSMTSWYHLSFGDGTLGCVDTHTQSAIVRQQDHKISRLPRSEFDGIQLTEAVLFDMLGCWYAASLREQYDVGGCERAVELATTRNKS